MRGNYVIDPETQPYPQCIPIGTDPAVGGLPPRAGTGSWRQRSSVSALGSTGKRISPISAFAADDCLEGIQPLAGFLRIGVDKLVDQMVRGLLVCAHGSIFPRIWLELSTQNRIALDYLLRIRPRFGGLISWNYLSHI